MSLVGQGVLVRWRTPCGRRGGKWSQHVSTQSLATGTDVLRTRCTGGTTICLSCVGNTSQRGGDLSAQRVTLCCARHEKEENQL